MIIHSVNSVTNINSCQNITSSGYYELTQNLNSDYGCIVINVSDVVLNCNGYQINFSRNVISGYDYHGIDTQVGVIKNNITIKNCYIVNGNSSGGDCSHSIRFGLVNNSYVLNNTIITKCGPTLPSWNVYNSIIANNTLIKLSSGDENILIYNSENNIYENNIINTTNSAWASIKLDYNPKNNIFRYNYIYHYGTIGTWGVVNIDDGINNTLFQNHIYTINSSLNTINIQINNPKNNTICGNYLESKLGKSIEISVAGASGNLIYNNTFNSSLGESDSGSGNFWNNSISGNYYARINGTGFSQNSTLCNDSNSDGICDNTYTIAGTAGSLDYKPLSINTFSQVESPTQIFTNTTPSNIFPVYGVISMFATFAILLSYFIFI